jgi:Protein of unknown function (DUF3443)
MTGTTRYSILTAGRLSQNAQRTLTLLRTVLLVSLFTMTFMMAGCNMTGANGNGGNNGGVSTTPPPPPPAPTPSAPNELPIVVSAGPGSSSALNRPFASLTICVPGTSNCQTIDNVLVDEGSTGLRIFSSLINLPLAPQPAPSGATYECAPFEGSYAWGPVVTADIKLSGEIAPSASVQLVGDNTFPVPSSCSNGQQPNSTPQQAGLNGVLGVWGLTDCASCVAGGPNNYWGCASSACQPYPLGPAQPVANPVSLFATDNNGVVFDMPGITATGAVNVQGSLYFGIGTQANNQLGSAQEYQFPMLAEINGTLYPVGIDSGTPFMGYLSDSLAGDLPLCGAFYCPSSPVNFSFEVVGANGAAFNVNTTAADPTAAVQQGMTAEQNLVGPGYGGDTVMLGFPFFYNSKIFFSWANPTTGSVDYTAF